MGGQFPGLLGDLMRMMQTAAPLQWDLAVRFAQMVAADGQTEANVDPALRIRFEELARLADLHVADVTGMPTARGGRQATFVATGPAEWARRSLDSWRPLVEQFASAIRPADGATLGSDEPAEQSDVDLGRLMGQWAKAIGPAMIALQVGSAVGHLARRTLGQYELPLPRRESDEIAVVPENVSRFAADWSLDYDDVALWAAARDLAMHAVLSRPHVHDRYQELLLLHAGTLRPDLQALAERLGEQPPGSFEDLGDLGRVLGGGTGFDEDEDSPDTRRVRAELGALSAALEGYVDWATDAVAERVTGARRPVAEAMRRRLVERTDEERAAESLFGLDLDQDTVDRGGAFVAGILARSGPTELDKLWTDAAHLPTPAEVDAPGLWIARVNL